MRDLPLAMTARWTAHPSPIGDLLLVGDGEALEGLYTTPPAAGSPFPERRDPRAERRDPLAFARAREQLDAYFAGELTEFDLPLRPTGTPFQRLVWDALRGLRFGETTTYAALAARIGRPTACRAVGAANGRNPISIVVPCHRVVGASGALTGYGGGVERKRALLEHESRVLATR